MTSTQTSAYTFIKESNLIEGIIREPSQAEMAEYIRFLAIGKLCVDDIVQFLGVYQPDALLRGHTGVPGVRVGSHIAPPLGANIIQELANIINAANDGLDPYKTHKWYETLHPFTDGNGRSGRMLWLWMMKVAPLGFLHTWYYQSLSDRK